MGAYARLCPGPDRLLVPAVTPRPLRGSQHPRVLRRSHREEGRSLARSALRHWVSHRDAGGRYGRAAGCRCRRSPDIDADSHVRLASGAVRPNRTLRTSPRPLADRRDSRDRRSLPKLRWCYGRRTSAHKIAMSSSMASNGSARTFAASACVATMVHLPSVSRSTSSMRSKGSTNHAWGIPSRA